MQTRISPGRFLTWLLAAAWLLAACADAPGSIEADPSPTRAGPAFAAEADRTIAIETASSACSPDDVIVSAGETVTFEITNVDAVDHDFVLGDEAIQQEHADLMTRVGQDDGTPHELVHEEPNAVSIPAGGSSTITWTFSEPGTVLYGCQVPGRYQSDMLGTITILA